MTYKTWQGMDHEVQAHSSPTTPTVTSCAEYLYVGLLKYYPFILRTFLDKSILATEVFCNFPGLLLLMLQRKYVLLGALQKLSRAKRQGPPDSKQIQVTRELNVLGKSLGTPSSGHF